MPTVTQANAQGTAPSRARQRVDAFCEMAIVVVVLLLIVWGPLAFGGFPAEGFLGIQGLTVLALALWVVRLWAQGPARLLWPPICWAVYVFILYALVRCRYVDIEFVARRELIEVIVYASLFMVVVNNIHRRESVSAIAVCLIVLGMLLSWDAIHQFATKSAYVWGVARRPQYIGRGGATYINPNHLAGFLGMAIPLALAYAVRSRFRPVAKVFFGYCALAMMAGVGVTLSRGGMVSVGATLAIFSLVLMCQRGYWLPAVAVVVVVGCLALVLATQMESIQKRFHGLIVNGQVYDPRYDYWPAAIHIFEDHPIWGGGPGHFDSEFAKYRPQKVQVRPGFAHNDYLNTLSDWGGVGLTIIFVALALLTYGVIRTWPAAPADGPDQPGLWRSDKAAFLMGASLGVVDIVFHSAVDFNMHIPANAAILVILMALMSGYWRFATERFWFEPGWVGKILMTCVMAAAMAWLAVQGIHRGREAYWQHRSVDESASWNDRLDGLLNAYKAEPSNYANAYNMGEYYRIVSLDAKPGYESQALQALQWYALAMKDNPLVAYMPMRYGQCLDWLGRTNEATLYFNQAVALDPTNSEMSYYMARHWVEMGDFQTANKWFQHSIDIQWSDAAWYGLLSMKERAHDASGLYITPPSPPSK